MQELGKKAKYKQLFDIMYFSNRYSYISGERGNIFVKSEFLASMLKNICGSSIPQHCVCGKSVVGKHFMVRLPTIQYCPSKNTHYKVFRAVITLLSIVCQFLCHTVWFITWKVV